MEKSFQISDIEHKVVSQWTHNPYIALNSLLRQPQSVLNMRSGTTIQQYPQLTQAAITNYPKYSKYNSKFQLLAKLLKLRIFNSSILDNPVIGHGYNHGYRVAKLVTIESLINHFTATRTETLILAAFIHDIGRNWANLADEHHGAKSIQVLCQILNIPQLNNQAINESLFGNSPIRFSEDDVIILTNIVTNHSLSIPVKPIDLPIKPELIPRESADESILEDCDALDRIRFRNNLNINYLRNDQSLCLLLLSYQLIQHTKTSTR